MSPQVIHALKQAVIMVAIAALGSLVQSQTDILAALQVNPVWWPVVGAALAGAVRWFEGARDGVRARAGDIVPADVGYQEVKTLEAARGFA